MTHLSRVLSYTSASYWHVTHCSPSKYCSSGHASHIPFSLHIGLSEGQSALVRHWAHFFKSSYQKGVSGGQFSQTFLFVLQIGASDLQSLSVRHCTQTFKFASHTGLPASSCAQLTHLSPDITGVFNGQQAHSDALNMLFIQSFSSMEQTQTPAAFKISFGLSQIQAPSISKVPLGHKHKLFCHNLGG